MRIKNLIQFAAAAVVAAVSAQAQVVQQAPSLATIQPQTVPIPLGPTLDVIPHVSADGYTIQMYLIPTVTEFLGYDDPGAFRAVVGNQAAPVPLPRFRVRMVTTSSIVWDGQTVVLGGLIREDAVKIKDKIPFLGDIPMLGKLFRSEIENNVKRNLLVFVTAKLINPAGELIHRTATTASSASPAPAPPGGPAR